MNQIKQNKKTIQFSSGRGPIECEWVVAQLIKIFYQELKHQKIEYSVLYSTLGQQTGTLQSVTLDLSGELKTVDNFLTNWLGVLQYIGKSPYRKFHKRKNWFIGVQEISDLKELNIAETDIEYQAVRSSGAGGQNVNKVNNAVRATYTPTQTPVFAMDSRSQFENKKLAKKTVD